MPGSSTDAPAAPGASKFFGGKPWFTQEDIDLEVPMYNIRADLSAHIAKLEAEQKKKAAELAAAVQQMQSIAAGMAKQQKKQQDSERRKMLGRAQASS